MEVRTWIAAALAMLAASWGSAQGAETFPTHPVRIIVGFAPGGANDIVTRIVAQKLYEIWGQTVVVDNRGGAGGNIAGELTAKSNPDGYTLFMTSGSIVTANQHLYKRMTYNPDKDLLAITSVASGPQIIVVNPSAPWKTVKDLISAAKAKPKSTAKAVPPAPPSWRFPTTTATACSRAWATSSPTRRSASCSSTWARSRAGCV